MATVSLVPIEEYLASDYEPDAEYVDGEVEQRPMGEYDHSTWQQALQRWFVGHGKQFNLRVRAELRVQVTPTRYRVPDVVVFDRNLPIEQVLTTPPIAVFEVLSPEDRIERMLRKLQDYASMGIKNIFVIDPKNHVRYRYQSGSLNQLTQDVENLEGTALSIDWQAIAQLDD